MGFIGVHGGSDAHFRARFGRDGAASKMIWLWDRLFDRRFESKRSLFPIAGARAPPQTQETRIRRHPPTAPPSESKTPLGKRFGMSR
jgi:hypothetical protein